MRGRAPSARSGTWPVSTATAGAPNPPACHPGTTETAVPGPGGVDPSTAPRLSTGRGGTPVGRLPAGPNVDRVFEQSARDPGLPVNDRLAWLADQLSPDASTVGPGGRLVRRWLPGGPAGAGRRRWAFAGVVAAVVVIVLGSVALLGGRPAPEPPPALPSAKPAGEARAAPQAGLVVSVIG